LIHINLIQDNQLSKIIKDRTYGTGFALVLRRRKEHIMKTLLFCPKEKGFSLVELTIVVTIIGVLAALAIPTFMSSSAKAKQSEAQLILKQIYIMQHTYRQEKDTYYPSDGSTIVVHPGETIGPLNVEVASSARYSYSITGNQTSFTATAGTKSATGLDDDPTADVWTIDQNGTLTCVTNDAIQ
jgi:prepilin-type N-terminal cleavage/methylation domain-containing protein